MSGKGHRAVEDILPGSFTKEGLSQCHQLLQAGTTDLTQNGGFKRLGLDSLRSLAKPSSGPFQFAHQPDVRVDDAITYLPFCAYTRPPTEARQ